MLFNSIDFALFLPIVFGLYWALNRSRQAQNVLLLGASYLFYAWWDWRFLLLIVFSSAVDFAIGHALPKAKNDKQSKGLLAASLVVNLGLLFFFKYFHFFQDNFIETFRFFGQTFEAASLNIILPVGISFYTFQTLSYTIDIYKKKLKPTSDPIAFFAYVSFFPQLVAGPIERASRLLPQFESNRNFDDQKARAGLRQMLWGLFKKIVIADNCAEYVNLVFEQPETYSSGMLCLAAVLFAIQIYGDFSGYSDIAIGTAKLFGFDLMKNFDFPYFSKNIAEFWRRWHISLSTWFRDYLYIPLGGNRAGRWKAYRNVTIVFLVSGFWHGANWTFIAWGLVHALLFLPFFIVKNRKESKVPSASDGIIFKLKEVFQIFFTFILVVLTWVLFRAESIQAAIQYYHLMFADFSTQPKDFFFREDLTTLYLLLVFFIAIEWTARNRTFALADLPQRWNPIIRWTFYFLILLMMGLFMSVEESPFIYFQF